MKEKLISLRKLDLAGSVIAAIALVSMICELTIVFATPTDSATNATFVFQFIFMIVTIIAYCFGIPIMITTSIFCFIYYGDLNNDLDNQRILVCGIMIFFSMFISGFVLYGFLKTMINNNNEPSNNNVGTNIVNNPIDPLDNMKQHLQKLQDMKDNNLISDEEYKHLRNQELGMSN